MAVMLLVARLLFIGKVDQTWVCVESSLFSELAPGPIPGCGDAVPAEQVRDSCVLALQNTIQLMGSYARGGR